MIKNSEKNSTSSSGNFSNDSLGADTPSSDVQAAKAALEVIRLNKFLDANISDFQVRISLAPFHPMLESNYFIDTEQASNFYSVVYDCVLARKSGLYCMGEFRVGKTKAIFNAISRLANDMPWAAVFLHSAKRVTHQTKKSFCLDLIRSFNCFISKRQEAETFLCRYLITEAIKAGSKTCVLFIDEAQMLTVLQLRYLLEVWNELKIEGFALVTVLVGQKGLDSLKQLTGEEDHGAVVARFFANSLHIGGLHTLDQLSAYLEAFDSSLEYPPDSNWSYSQFFCHKAFSSGWRLSAETHVFWSSLILFARPSKKALQKSGFRLAFVNDAIHGFLLDSMHADKVNFKGTKKLWTTAIAQAATADLLIGGEHV